MDDKSKLSLEDIAEAFEVEDLNTVHLEKTKVSNLLWLTNDEKISLPHLKELIADFHLNSPEGLNAFLSASPGTLKTVLGKNTGACAALCRYFNTNKKPGTLDPDCEGDPLSPKIFKTFICHTEPETLRLMMKHVESEAIPAVRKTHWDPPLVPGMSPDQRNDHWNKYRQIRQIRANLHPSDWDTFVDKMTKLKEKNVLTDEECKAICTPPAIGVGGDLINVLDVRLAKLNLSPTPRSFLKVGNMSEFTYADMHPNYPFMERIRNMNSEIYNKNPILKDPNRQFYGRVQRLSAMAHKLQKEFCTFRAIGERNPAGENEEYIITNEDTEKIRKIAIKCFPQNEKGATDQISRDDVQNVIVQEFGWRYVQALMRDSYDPHIYLSHIKNRDGTEKVMKQFIANRASK